MATTFADTERFKDIQIIKLYPIKIKTANLKISGQPSKAA